LPLDPLLQEIVGSTGKGPIPDYPQRLLPQTQDPYTFAAPSRPKAWQNVLRTALGLDDPNSTASKVHRAVELVAGLNDPTGSPPVKGVLIGARGIRAAGKEAQIKFELGRQALEAGEDAAQVHRKYGVSKTKEGDLAYEIPLRETEAGALQQFKEHYPDVTLRVLRNQGERSGYYYAPEKELFAQGKVGGDITKPASRRRVLEHELQHAVDDLEGRSHGASPGVNYLSKAWEDPQYWKNAAEVRARAVEQRLDPEMRAFPPQVNEGVPREQQIIKQDPRAVMEAVKEPGGMWHPEAVERLANPLFGKLQGDTGVGVGPALRISEGSTHPKDVAIRNAARWSDRAIRNYLNKYAGTTRDPLKDVEVPFGEGVKRWEELMDASIGKVKKEGIVPGTDSGLGSPFPGWERMKPGEEVHGIDNYTGGDQYRGSADALKSYLSHVGDYLRQNVAPEKLGQYDLVRAVRETAANDARMARESAKAAQASMKDLPVHKEYPTGFKWVELKKPERLTEEQLKQVRWQKSGHDAGGAETGDFLAIGADGKPIRNSYTDEIARGSTPEEAWLAGRLAEEGNTMGHCVGGYCEPVASGESRIYSLRGPDGKSHVTVEVAPPDVRFEQNSPAAFAKAVGGDLYKRWREITSYHDEVALTRKIVQSSEYQKWIDERPTDIIQIKGKANRAPNKEYLPYVQDFVKSGKWGEVGDLENTALKEFNGQYFTQEELAKHLGVSPNNVELELTRRAGAALRRLQGLE